MSELRKIPVIVITGFLGSGKTTLLNRLLADGVKTAVVINEFGATLIDQDLLQNQDIPMTVLAGGCLCCQIKGALAPTLKNLWMAWDQAGTKPFERIIIEASGVASPEPIMDTLLRDRWLSSRYRLKRVITTLAIPSAIEQMENFAEARAQVAWADALLLTHDDLADADQHTALDAYLQAITPATPRHRATRERCDTDTLLADSLQHIRIRPNSELPPEHGFRTISLHLEQPILWLRLHTILQDLLVSHHKDLLRIKGVVYLSEQVQPVIVQAAANRLYPPSPLPCRASDDHRGRLVFITTDDPQSLANELVTAIGCQLGRDAVRLH